MSADPGDHSCSWCFIGIYDVLWVAKTSPVFGTLVMMFLSLFVIYLDYGKAVITTVIKFIGNGMSHQGTGAQFTCFILHPHPSIHVSIHPFINLFNFRQVHVVGYNYVWVILIRCVAPLYFAHLMRITLTVEMSSEQKSGELYAIKRSNHGAFWRRQQRNTSGVNFWATLYFTNERTRMKQRV